MPTLVDTLTPIGVAVPFITVLPEAVGVPTDETALTPFGEAVPPAEVVGVPIDEETETPVAVLFAPPDDVGVPIEAVTLTPSGYAVPSTGTTEEPKK